MLQHNTLPGKTSLRRPPVMLKHNLPCKTPRQSRVMLQHNTLPGKTSRYAEA